MKPNRLKQALTEGRVPVGHMVVEFNTRGMPQMLEKTGADFVLLDMEHTGFSASDIADLVAGFRLTTVTPLVRVPQIEYHFIARALDVGAMGVMVPNVQTGAEARAIVAAAKYAPLGQRRVALGAAHTDYERVDPGEVFRYANENTTVICQIESQKGLDQIDEIATTPGVDLLWVGHFDLSQSMGIPGEFDHPDFLAAVKLVIDTAKRHGLGAGIQPHNLAQTQHWMAMGFDVISYSSDLSVYIDAMTKAVAGVRELASGG